MKKGTIIENIKVDKLVFGWKWLVKRENDKNIFVVWGPVPGAIYNLKVLKSKNNYLETQIVETVKPAGYEKPIRCVMDWESGGARWQNIPYEKQLEIKEEQVTESLHNLKKIQPDIEILPIKPSPIVWGYRNKMEYSFGNYISTKEDIDKRNLLGFHKQWEFSKVVDVTSSCLVNDEYNEVYLELKKALLGLWHDVFDSFKNEWLFRHLTIRKTHFTNEFMIILSYNPNYDKDFSKNEIKDILINIAKKRPNIVSVYLSENGWKSDIAILDLELIYWEKIIKENLLGLTFNISPRSFFQTNSAWAEDLYSIVLDFAHKKELKDKTILDLYAGTWTIWMIFAKHAKNVVSVELVKQASEDGKENAKLNWISNMEFKNAKVEDYLDDYIAEWKTADLIVIDPPRAGMHKNAVPNILKFKAPQLIYVSCNPSTLARDLEDIMATWEYKIEKIRAMDMFPHTHHIETVVSLIRKDS